jgi:hypothetical protein
MTKNIHQLIGRNALLLALCTGFFACEKGEEKAGLAPDTKIAIDKINLSGETRLTSSVQLNWTGYDQDGYVTGFEISQDGGLTWSAPITKTDSLFRFNFTGTTDTADISFQVRAIDDDQIKDPTPAVLTIPIKNSAPVVRVDSSIAQLSDTIYSVLTLGWRATDSDGNETLEAVYVKVNDGTWQTFPATVSTITLVPENPKQNGAGNAKLYVGFNAQLSPIRIAGLVVGDTNRIYIKTKDIASAESKEVKTKKYFLKRQTSDLLVVDTHIGSTDPKPENTYFPYLREIYPAGFDHVDMLRNAGENQPRLWNTTFPLMLGLYNKVFWYSDDQKNSVADRNLMPLEAACSAIQKYLNNGGKLMVTSKFPDGVSRLSRDSQIFSVMPMDSITWKTSELRLIGNRVITAVPDKGYTNMKTLPSGSGGTITGVDVFYTSSPDTLYNIPVSRTSGTWTGSTKIAARKTYSNGRTNLVFFSVELHILNGDAAALKATFNKVLNDEFNW